MQEWVCWSRLSALHASTLLHKTRCKLVNQTARRELINYTPARVARARVRLLSFALSLSAVALTSVCMSASVKLHFQRLRSP